MLFIDPVYAAIFLDNGPRSFVISRQLTSKTKDDNRYRRGLANLQYSILVFGCAMLGVVMRVCSSCVVVGNPLTVDLLARCPHYHSLSGETRAGRKDLRVEENDLPNPGAIFPAT